MGPVEDKSRPNPIRIVDKSSASDTNPVYEIECPKCGKRVGKMETIKMAYGDEEDTHVLCCANCNEVISKEGRSQ